MGKCLTSALDDENYGSDVFDHGVYLTIALEVDCRGYGVF